MVRSRYEADPKQVRDRHEENPAQVREINRGKVVHSIALPTGAARRFLSGIVARGLMRS